MKRMIIWIEKVRDVETPKYAHEGDAGLDLYSATDTEIASGKRKIIKTGIKLAIPDGYVGLIWDRSGLAAKSGLHCLAGVIDSGYRGEVGVVLINLGDDTFKVRKNTRIAQLLLQPVVRANIEIAKLELTQRGHKGFGSTGQ